MEVDAVANRGHGPCSDQPKVTLVGVKDSVSAGRTQYVGQFAVRCDLLNYKMVKLAKMA